MRPIAMTTFAAILAFRAASSVVMTFAAPKPTSSLAAAAAPAPITRMANDPPTCFANVTTHVLLSPLLA